MYNKSYMELILKTENDNEAVSEIIKGWGSDILVSRGKPHKAQGLDGILAWDNGKIIEMAKENKCKKIWLVTTNSNINAIKFYQKRGFDISNIYINAMNKARKIKPEIPEIAENGIKIRDEIEFEIK
jgi:hypothetical protein